MENNQIPSSSTTELSEFKSKSGLKRISSAFFYSIDGLKSAWNTEHAFRQELFLVLIGSAIAIFLPISIFEKLMLVVVLLFVLVVELINSAIEAVVDRISLERHDLSKNAKDFGSAAVLLSLLIALLTWSVVLIDRFYY